MWEPKALLEASSVAIDGSKFKAVSNRDKNFTEAKMKRRLEQIDESIARYLSQLDTADHQGPTVPEAKTTRLKEKIAELREEIGRLNALNARMMASEDKQISLSDLTVGSRCSFDGDQRQGQRDRRLQRWRDKRRRPKRKSRFIHSYCRALLALCPGPMLRRAYLQKPLALQSNRPRTFQDRLLGELSIGKTRIRWSAVTTMPPGHVVGDQTPGSQGPGPRCRNPTTRCRRAMPGRAPQHHRTAQDCGAGDPHRMGRTPHSASRSSRHDAAGSFRG